MGAPFTQGALLQWVWECGYLLVAVCVPAAALGTMLVLVFWRSGKRGASMSDLFRADVWARLFHNYTRQLLVVCIPAAGVGAAMALTFCRGCSASDRGSVVPHVRTPGVADAGKGHGQSGGTGPTPGAGSAGVEDAAELRRQTEALQAGSVQTADLVKAHSELLTRIDSLLAATGAAAVRAADAEARSITTAADIELLKAEVLKIEEIRRRDKAMQYSINQLRGLLYELNRPPPDGRGPSSAAGR